MTEEFKRGLATGIAIGGVTVNKTQQGGSLICTELLTQPTGEVIRNNIMSSSYTEVNQTDNS